MAADVQVDDDGPIFGYKQVGDCISPITEEEFDGLPEAIMETLSIHATCVYDGVVYGGSKKQLLSDDNEPMWRTGE